MSKEIAPAGLKLVPDEGPVVWPRGIDLVALSASRFSGTYTLSIVAGLENHAYSDLEDRINAIATSGRLFPVVPLEEIVFSDVREANSLSGLEQIALDLLRADLPKVVLLRSDLGLALIHDHSLGDGYVSTVLLMELLGMNPQVKTLQQRLPVLDLLRVVAKAASGTSVIAHARILRAQMIGVKERTRAMAEQRAAPGEVASGRICSRTYIYGEDQLRRIRDDYSSSSPKVSSATIVSYVVLSSAFNVLEGPVRYRYAVGLRRYGSLLETIGGNLTDFFDGSWIKLPTLPEFDSELKRYVNSAGPLVSFLMKSIRSHVRAGKAKVSEVPEIAGPSFRSPLLTFSNRGYLGDWWDERLSWSSSNEKKVVLGVSSPEPGKIAVNMHRRDDQLVVSVTHVDRTVQSEVIEGITSRLEQLGL